jgi:hypothetical protein
MNKKLNWFNEADISSLAYEASYHFAKNVIKEGDVRSLSTPEDSFIYKHHEDILKDGYYQLFETDFQSFSKYAKYFGFEPIRED